MRRLRPGGGDPDAERRRPGESPWESKQDHGDLGEPETSEPPRNTSESPSGTSEPPLPATELPRAEAEQHPEPSPPPWTTTEPARDTSELPSSTANGGTEPEPWSWPVTDWRRAFLLGGAAVVVALLGAGVALGVSALLRDSDAATAPAPSAVIDPGVEPQEPEELGFPSFATQNTTRVGGADPAADAAGIALATYPSTGGVEGPAAVSIVGSSDWQGAVAAASLAAPPIGAPVLVSDADGVPTLTLEAIEGLAPSGSPATRGAQVFRIGAPSVPGGLDVLEMAGADPAALAAKLDRIRGRLTGRDPSHVLVVSAESPEFAVPAAAWAARSGDPVLFVEADSVPGATLRALRRHEGAQAYVLGPERVISDRVLSRVDRAVAGAERISGGSPVTNAIAFARFSDGEFGWDINDPGHGFVIANTARPLDAAVAAPLSATGKPGPLLLTDDAEAVPDPLRGFLLDTKPGYVDDPTRAVYNHVWLIGDQESITAGFQAQVDDLTELVRVTSGSGDPGAAGGVGPPEGETQAG